VPRRGKAGASARQCEARQMPWRDKARLAKCAVTQGEARLVRRQGKCVARQGNCLGKERRRKVRFVAKQGKSRQDNCRVKARRDNARQDTANAKDSKARRGNVSAGVRQGMTRDNQGEGNKCRGKAWQGKCRSKARRGMCRV
jgi:hypothetical protein